MKPSANMEEKKQQTLQKWMKYIQRTEHKEEDTSWVDWNMGTLLKFQDHI